MAFYSFKRTQKINASSAELWKFISDPSNLSQITPPEMDFRVTTEYLPAKMYPGLMISYLVRPIAGIPTKWLTEITHVKDGEYFVDEQRVGPYKLWHHQHQLIPIQNGTLMRDIVTYQPPFSILGALANKLFIRKRLEKIFDYRKEKLEDIFGKYDSRYHYPALIAS